MREITYTAAAPEGLDEEMARDPSIFVVGEGIGKRGGNFNTTAGLYETSGDWLYDVGLPGKSGIGGGIVTVSPGKGGLGTFAPPLDAAGNSVKGQLVAKYLSQRLGMDLFVSKPEV